MPRRPIGTRVAPVCAIRILNATVMRALELKLPPAVVWLLAAVVMWGVARAVPAGDVELPARGWLATAGWLAGLAVGALGVRSFRRAGTTISPLEPAKASVLVVNGIYRRTRNPMYLALLCLLAGWACVLANLPAALVLPGFVAYLTRFQIVPEERALTERFGPEFTAYCARVRRWF